MSAFLDMDERGLRDLIEQPWESLHSKVCEFQNLMDKWVQTRPQHLPATAELLCRNMPTIPDPKSFGLSDRGSRFVDGYGAETSSDGDPPQKVLMMMFGYSAEQLALSIAFHYRVSHCRYFVPFCGDKLKHQRTDVADLLSHALRKSYVSNLANLSDESSAPRIVGSLNEMNSDNIFLAPVDKTRFENEIERTHDPSNVFGSLMKWLKTPPPPFDRGRWGIGVEVTGGQKTMDSGATAFASYYGLPAFYLDSEEYDEDLRRPHPKSTRCKVLLLPAASFSHRSREAILERFRSHDFAVARAMNAELIASLGSVAGPVATKDHDHAASGSTGDAIGENDKELSSLNELLTNSQSFMESHYAAPAIRDLPRPEESTVDDSGDQQIQINRLLDNLGVRDDDPSQPRGDWRRFFDYVADEYYRLEAILGQPKTTPYEDIGRNYREVVLAGFGLAELIVEAMTRITGVVIERAYPTKGEDGQLNDSLKQRIENAARDENGDYRDVGKYWHMDYESKWTLVRTGRAGHVSMWFYDDNGDHGKLVFEPSTKPKGKHITGCVKLVTRKRSGYLTLKNREKNGKLWGEPYSDGQWKKVRNAITHMRAPLNPATQKIAIDAIKTYLPGLIEILYRLANRLEPIDCTEAANADWVQWNKEQSEWTRRHRVPWFEKENSVRNWLSIDFATPEVFVSPDV